MFTIFLTIKLPFFQYSQEVLFSVCLDRPGAKMRSVRNPLHVGRRLAAHLANRGSLPVQLDQSAQMAAHHRDTLPGTCVISSERAAFVRPLPPVDSLQPVCDILKNPRI